VADDPLQSFRAAHLALTVAAKLREVDDIVKTARTSGVDPALAMIGTMGEVRSQIDQMMDHERFLLAGWETRADALEQSKTWLIASAAAIVAVFAGARWRSRDSKRDGGGERPTRTSSSTATLKSATRRSGACSTPTSSGSSSGISKAAFLRPMTRFFA
jgi:hypothetical protein